MGVGPARCTHKSMLGPRSISQHIWQMRGLDTEECKAWVCVCCLHAQMWWSKGCCLDCYLIIGYLGVSACCVTISGSSEVWSIYKWSSDTIQVRLTVASWSMASNSWPPISGHHMSMILVLRRCVYNKLYTPTAIWRLCVIWVVIPNWGNTWPKCALMIIFTSGINRIIY